MIGINIIKILPRTILVIMAFILLASCGGGPLSKIPPGPEIAMLKQAIKDKKPAMGYFYSPG